MLVIMFIIILLSETLGRNKYEKTFIFNFPLSMWSFYTGYLLIVKKSYNLLAGMTEEKAIEIKNNSVEEKKSNKNSKNCRIYSYYYRIGIVSDSMGFN